MCSTYLFKSVTHSLSAIFVIFPPCANRTKPLLILNEVGMNEALLPCHRAECHRVPGPRAAAVLAHLLAARCAYAGLLAGAAAAVQLLEAHLAPAMEWVGNIQAAPHSL